MLPGVQKSVRERTLTLPSELPFWESNLHRAIAGVKTQWIKELFISLEKY
jgi:hypothetical protein